MTSLTLVRRIAARPGVVFEALTAPDGIRAWFGPDAGPVLLAETDLRLGGCYRVRFQMLDGSEHEAAGEYVELEPPWHVAMTWRWITGGGDSGESRLAFELRVITGGTELTLTHARLESDAARDGHTSGWTGALDKLEANLGRLEAEGSEA